MLPGHAMTGLRPGREAGRGQQGGEPEMSAYRQQSSVRRRDLLGASALACAVLALASPARAQEQSGDAQAASVGPQEIIVTARKRQESALKVPVVLNSITQDTIENYAIQDIYSAAARVPGFTIGTGIVSAGPQVSIRGIGTTANNPTVDQSVSLNIDGLQFSQGLAYASGLFDVGQIDVLKGPQALFYGKNSPAGVIAIRTADPTNEFELMLRTGYEFEAKERIAEVVASGPLSPSLKVRLAGRLSDQDGFFTNGAEGIAALGGMTPTDRHVSPTRSWILRGTVLFSPGNRYDARLKVNYTHDRVDNATPAQLGYCPDGTGSVAPINIPFITGDDCKLNRTIHNAWFLPSAFPGISNSGVPFATSRQVFGTLEQNLKLDDALTLTSVTGAYWLDQRTLFAGGTARAAVPIAVDNEFKISDFTQELRLTSDFQGPLNFMLGGFFEDGKQKNNILLRGDTALGLPATLANALHTIDIRSYSLFGQARWKLTPQLELAAGLRWTDEKRIHTEINYAASNGPLGPVPLLDPRLKSDNVSPDVTLTYTPTDDLTLFASYKQGFKSGSFNTLIFISPTTRASFNDEKVKGGEIGLKTRLLDRSLSLNLAAYYYRYSNLQVGANELSGGAVIATRTINAASANVKGVDFDMTYAPPGIEGLTLHGALNYNHARYASFPNAPCGNGQTIAEGCDQILNTTTGRYTSQDLSGRRLVRAPEWSGNIGFDYELPVGKDMRVSFGSLLNYTSSYTTALVDLPGFAFGPYTKIDGNITLKGPDDRWDIALIGRNLTNRISTGQCFNSNTQNGVIFGGQVAGAVNPGPAGGDEAVCLADRGREVWVRFTMRMR